MNIQLSMQITNAYPNARTEEILTQPLTIKIIENDVNLTTTKETGFLYKSWSDWDN